MDLLWEGSGSSKNSFDSGFFEGAIVVLQFVWQTISPMFFRMIYEENIKEITRNHIFGVLDSNKKTTPALERLSTRSHFNDHGIALPWARVGVTQRAVPKGCSDQTESTCRILWVDLDHLLEFCKNISLFWLFSKWRKMPYDSLTKELKNLKLTNIASSL